eukprot:TRINITY_DN19722_c0_g2_i1.p2 TRINITY_DN19722_c0_g2~~TRINITY_DN19722_c0_g2_i1.p2  ORF type:complete len:503 (+),score=78.72 TRINITY_DN19722_c0_g2_i1:84-1592(+)
MDAAVFSWMAQLADSIRSDAIAILEEMETTRRELEARQQDIKNALSGVCPDTLHMQFHGLDGVKYTFHRQPGPTHTAPYYDCTDFTVDDQKRPLRLHLKTKPVQWECVFSHERYLSSAGRVLFFRSRMIPCMLPPQDQALVWEYPDSCNSFPVSIIDPLGRDLLDRHGEARDLMCHCSDKAKALASQEHQLNEIAQKLKRLGYSHLDTWTGAQCDDDGGSQCDDHNPQVDSEPRSFNTEVDLGMDGRLDSKEWEGFLKWPRAHVKPDMRFGTLIVGGNCHGCFLRMQAVTRVFTEHLKALDLKAGASAFSPAENVEDSRPHLDRVCAIRRYALGMLRESSHKIFKQRSKKERREPGADVHFHDLFADEVNPDAVNPKQDCNATVVYVTVVLAVVLLFHRIKVRTIQGWKYSRRNGQRFVHLWLIAKAPDCFGAREYPEVNAVVDCYLPDCLLKDRKLYRQRSNEDGTIQTMGQGESDNMSRKVLLGGKAVGCKTRVRKVFVP